MKIAMADMIDRSNDENDSKQAYINGHAGRQNQNVKIDSFPRLSTSLQYEEHCMYDSTSAIKLASTIEICGRRYTQLHSNM